MAEQEHIYFGSLEEQERQRIEQEENDNMSMASQTTKATISQPPQAQGINLDTLLPPAPVSRPNNISSQVPQQQNNNIDVARQDIEVIELSEESQRAKERHEKAIQQLELKQTLNRIQLPTSDLEVKHRLRELGEPICYFGEQPINRRERLRQKCAEYMMEKGEMPQFKAMEHQGDENEEHEHFRYLGPANLKDIRKVIVEHSLKAAALRIEHEKLRQAEMEPLEQEDELIKENFEASKYNLLMSQFADTSAISKGDFSKDGSYFATAGGSGACKIWTVPGCDLKTSLNGHLSKVHDIKFHPMSTIGLEEGSYANIATCGSDQNIRLWTFRQENEFQKSLVLKGHEDRVNKVVYHPTGNYLFSSSHDNTWKFWDLETQKAVITQTGHASAVYALAVHGDGSLIFSGDFCGQGVMWDIRSGRNILNLQGHVKNILCADFNSNGYQMASGGDDNTIRFWDIRRKHCAKIVPGHLKLVSDLCYQPGKSMFLTSVSYDNTVKVWNSQTFEMTANLGTQESKVTGVSICKETGYMATTSLDRKFSIWNKELE